MRESLARIALDAFRLESTGLRIPSFDSAPPYPPGAQEVDPVPGTVVNHDGAGGIRYQIRYTGGERAGATRWEWEGQARQPLPV